MAPPRDVSKRLKSLHQRMQHTSKPRLAEFVKRDVESLLNRVENQGRQRQTAIELHRETVEVWCGSIAQFIPQIEMLSQVLDDEERAQVVRFQFDRHREQFAIRRALLRVVLSRYNGIAPHQLKFRRGEFGKPELQQYPEQACLHFSSSHSNGVVLFAITRDGAVGADVEAVRPLADLDAMIARCLSNSEKSALNDRTGRDRLQDFFHYWTCKEAVLKGTGEGLSRPLESVQISLVDQASPRVVSREPESEHLCEWQLTSFAPEVGFVAAIATKNANASLRLIRF